MTAHMYPAKLDRNHIRFQGKRGQAEYQFYHALRDQLSDDWKVMWGRDLESPRPIDGSTAGEADFIVVHPYYGMYVLEVKGGGLAYDQDEHVWHCWGRDGEERALLRSPSDQVKRTIRLLRLILREDPSCPAFFKSPDFQIGWAVVFNQCRIYGTLPADLPRELILDETDVDRIEHRLTTRIYQYFLKIAVENAVEQDYKRGRHRRYHEMAREQIDDDVRRRFMRVSDDSWEYLRAKFLASELQVKLPRLSTRIKEETEQLNLLTDEQYHLIEMLEDREYPAGKVRGCSGSGKTLCAIELARRFAKRKKKVLLLCYNSALADWLDRETKPHQQYIDTDNIHGYCRVEFGAWLPSPEKAPPAKRSEVFDIEWPYTISQNPEKVKKTYDVIIVDEAQDFRGLWWSVIPQFRKDDLSRFYVFYDENQILYHDSAIKDIPISAPPLSLRRNCRNTRRIHDFIRAFYRGPDEIISQGPQGTLPRFFVYDTPEHQMDGFRRLLARWREGLSDVKQPYARVIALTMHGRTNTFLRNTLKLGNVNLEERSTRLAEAEEQARKPYSVLWSTDRRFKGLENDAVILLDIDQQAEDTFADNLIYVGGSRAKHRLYGFVHRRSLNWLRSRTNGLAEFFEDYSVLANLEL